MKLILASLFLLLPLLYQHLAAAAEPSIPAPEKSYFYEPSTVRLAGKLLAKPSEYESFSNVRSKISSENIFILKLHVPIDVKPDPRKELDSNEINVDEYKSVREMQVAFDPSKLRLDSYVNKDVVIEGYLYERDTGDQKTNVLIFLNKIFTKGSKNKDSGNP